MQDCGVAWVGGFLGGLLYLLTMSCVVSLCMLRATKNSDSKLAHGATAPGRQHVFAPEHGVARHGFTILREYGRTHSSVVGGATANTTSTATGSSGVCSIDLNSGAT